MNNLIELNHLSRSFIDGEGKQLQVLNEISCTIQKNTSYSIVGLSGSGKSTLLHLLGGLDSPTNGNILFHGKDILNQSDQELSNWRNQEIGFIFQFHHLLGDFTTLENVMLPAYIAGEKSSNAQKKALQLLKQVDLQNRIQHKPSQLSGGEKQRVAVARALINQPSLVLADEPTGSLDSINGEKVIQTLMDACKLSKASLILVTHNITLPQKTDIQWKLSEGKIQDITK